MNYRNAQLLDTLTQRFVLGTLSRRARRRFNRLVDEDNEIAAGVYALEDDLLPLAWSLQPVAPSQLVWQRICRSTGIGRSEQATNTSPARGPWAIAASVLLAAVLASTYGWWQETQQPPERVTETVTEYLAVEPAVGVVADANGNSLWVARIYPDLQRADLVVATEPEQQPGNDYELWVLRDDGVPVSLGLLPQSGERQLSLSAAAVDALGSGDVLAVSLEPLGGSPAAVPTGPVLYTAALLAP